MRQGDGGLKKKNKIISWILNNIIERTSQGLFWGIFFKIFQKIKNICIPFWKLFRNIFQECGDFWRMFFSRNSFYFLCFSFFLIIFFKVESFTIEFIFIYYFHGLTMFYRCLLFFKKYQTNTCDILLCLKKHFRKKYLSDNL